MGIGTLKCAVIDVEDVHGAAVLIDAVDDPVRAAPGAMAARQRAEQRLADAVRAHRERHGTELQHGGSD